MTSSPNRLQTEPVPQLPPKRATLAPPPGPALDMQARPHSVSPPCVSSTQDCRSIDLPKIHDPRGNLTFIEAGRHVPFEIRRAFWIYDVPGGSVRGGHAYRTVHELIVALSGSFEVMLDDGASQVRHTLNRSYHGLLVPNLIWREMINFSTNSVALVLASRPFALDDYVRDYADFLRLRGAQ
jgi:WxcM-like, C-terminal